MCFTIWYVNNPDSYQYLSIAKKYATLNWSLAPNAYWSPLFSWLLALPISIGLNGIIALKITQLIVGGFALYGWFLLTRKTGLKGILLLLVQAGIIPFVISYAQLNPTADILFLTVFIFLILNLSEGSWLVGYGSALVSGVFGAFLYYSKAFGFPLFIALMLISGIIRYWSTKDHIIWKKAGLSLMIFALISAPWIVLLSVKYNTLTLSKSTAFNFTKEVAPMPGEQVQLPVLTGGLIAPPDSLSASAWEAPGDVVSLHQLHPFGNKEDLKLWFRVLKRNILSIYYFDFRRQAGIFFLIIFIIYFFKKGYKNILNNRLILFLFLSMLCIYGGYSLILVHTRYIWVCTWIMMLMSAWMVQEMSEKGTRRIIFPVLFFLMLLVAMKRPVKEILFGEDKEVSALWLGKAITHPAQTMAIMYREDNLLKSFCQKMKEEHFLSGNMASLRNDSPERNYYASSLFVTSFLPLHYYGQLETHKTIDEQFEELKKNNIQFLFSWKNEAWTEGENQGVYPIIHDENTGIRIYKIETDQFIN